MNAIAYGSLEPSECYRAGRQYMDVCTVKCNPGYVLDSDSVEKPFCDVFGSWNFGGKYEPRCIRKFCCFLY